MKAFCTIATLGLTLIGAVGSASAQYYGRPDSYGRDYGYEERGGPRYRERDNYEERGPRSRGRENAFDERTYLRCNPDVRRAVVNGQMESGWAHYQKHGRREGRRLSC
jgi:hypothetical protein